jgi:hypothetical protein
MKQNNYRKAGWVIILIIAIALPLHAQTTKRFSIELNDRPLPTALKLVEKEGGKNIIFSYNETESYRVTASIRQKTETEAINILLNSTPFICKEREEYFVIQKKGKEARTSEIRGRVVNEKNEPLAYSNVLLLAANDSTFVNGCVSRTDGSFLIIAEKGGTPYILKASYIGYKTEVQTCHPNSILRLTPDTQLMQEVTVTARRPLIEVGPNGLKANVTGTSLAKMGSAAEMLSHLPFVTTGNGGYSVLGCGSPVIYINSRKVRDAAELDRLRANEIISAEVITTPGAEYASSVAAVIRLRTIRQRGQGLSGNFNTTYSQGHSANANEYMALNYRTGGLDIFVKGYMAQQNSYGETTNMNRIEGSAVWETNKSDVQINKNQRFSGELGFNYEPNEHHSFGMRYMPETRIGNADRNSYGQTITTRNGEEADRVNFTTSEQTHTGWDQAVNAYYVGEVGKWNIDFNADYLFKRSHSDQNAINNDDAPVLSNSRMRSYLYAAKLVASTPLWKGHFSFGTEETFTNRHDLFTQNGFSADADDNIKQSVYAVFADYSRSIHHWKLNAGIRYEHQQTDYYEKGIRKDAQSPSYNDIIPVLAASWSHNGKSFSLSYRMKKNNPDYSLLTNSISYRSKYEYSQGNPLLEAQKTHRFSASASWNWIYVSTYFSRILNMPVNMIMPYNEDTHPGVLLFTALTIPTTNNYGISINASPKLGYWEPQLNVNMAFLDMNAEKIGITRHRNQPRFYFNLDNNFNLPKGWFFNIEGYLSTAARQGSFVTRTEGQLNARLSKSFLQESLTVALTANDILRTGYFHFDLYGIDAYMENRIYRDFQRVGIQVSYKFNATKSKYRGTGAGQSEKNRL